MSSASGASADVEAIKEKLLNSSGRELRRTLFSLKQTFQEDKDLVREFVESDGLTCLISVGKEADQNYQNYILRALGQVMLYVDGMKGVIRHNQTIQWLYSILSAMVSPASASRTSHKSLSSHSFQYRLVVKTSLKLLLVFVEYTDTNCLLLMQAIAAIDAEKGEKVFYCSQQTHSCSSDCRSQQLEQLNQPVE